MDMNALYRLKILAGLLVTSIVNANPGEVDSSFRHPNTSWMVPVLLPGPEGSVLLGTIFTENGDVHSIQRLNADGSRDPSFNCPSNHLIKALGIRTDGSVLFAGQLYRVASEDLTLSGRPSGLVDSSGSLVPSFGQGLGDGIFHSAIHEDHDGNVTILSGASPRASRILPNGKLDPNYPGSKIFANCLSEKSPGVLIVGGEFQTLCGVGRNRIGALNTDGSLYSEFSPGSNDREMRSKRKRAGRDTGANGAVTSIVRQRDGKLLIAGTFSAIAGKPRSGLARLNPNGSVDETFVPTVEGKSEGRYPAILSVVIQCDGKIIIAGKFEKVNGVKTPNLARLMPNGTLDARFSVPRLTGESQPGRNSAILGLAIQSDGKILVGGQRGMLGKGDGRTAVRLLNDPAGQEFKKTDDGYVWLRSGSSPQLERAWIEEKKSKGWEKVILLEPTEAGWRAPEAFSSSETIRAVGVSRGGVRNGSFYHATCELSPSE